ncbi:MAG: TonB-dependent receptor, partial [Polymorphobacter sp.]
GTYLDEQPITTIQGALDLHIYDIARVEALAGPQGTLYGASAQAGVLRIITNKPDIGKLSASYTLGANITADGSPGWVGEAYVNAPVSDNAAVRLVGWYQHDGGYIDNVPATRTYGTSGITIDNYDIAQENFNWTDTYGARAALRVELGDNWAITPTIMGQVQESNGVFGYDPNIGELDVERFQPDTYLDQWAQAALLIEGKVGNFDLTYSGSYLTREIKSLSDYSDYSFFYDPVYGQYVIDDAGNLIDPSQSVIGRDNFSKQSHELRIASDSANRFRFVAGLFLQVQNHHINQNYYIQDLELASSISGFPGTIWLTNQQRTDKDYAVFGEASFDITSNFTATAGGRFYKYDNTLYGYYGLKSGERRCLPGQQPVVPGSPIVNGQPCTRLNNNVNDTGFLPKINLTYRFDGVGLVYATWSKGFRPGGVNRVPTVAATYEPDYLTNYEIGFKSSFADNRVRFNATLFYEDWTDMQLSFLGPNSVTVIQNAGNATSKGIEADITWAVNDGLTLSASATWLNAELTTNYCRITSGANDDCTLPPGNFIQAAEGTSLPVTPDFKGSAIARYQWMAGDYDAHVQGTVTYQSAFYTGLKDADRAVFGESPAYAQVNFTAGVARNNWSIELWGKNLFNVLGERSRYASCTTSVCGGNEYGAPGNGIVYTVPIVPLQVGLRFSQNF